MATMAIRILACPCDSPFFVVVLAVADFVICLLYTSNTYEWCKEGVTPQIDNLKGIPFESMPNWIHLFLQGENILMEELEDLSLIHI